MDIEQWWQNAVVYQVYLRSFRDDNGDGIGDLAGLRAALHYLVELGVDAIWIAPWYPSPLADGGYDVADYCDIHPDYGTLAEAGELIAAAHAHGIRVLVDIVPNHTSDAHPWFAAALRDEPGTRDRYWFRPGRGAAGTSPPNDWASVFGGPAWTRVPDGQWYLHLFATAQPDLNWQDTRVRQAFEHVLRFWSELGVDGFRIDVAHGLAKDPDLPDAGPRPPAGLMSITNHPAWDQDSVHEIYRAWRAVADEYTPPKVFVAEAWVSDNARLARYLRADELHTAFQFDLLKAPWRAEVLRTVVEDALTQAVEVGTPPTWVLSNHDITRTVTRYARSQPGHLVEGHWERARWTSEPPDLALGRRRARAAALLQLALPGSAYLYQGDELGLEEFEDMPNESRQDPSWPQSGYTDVGRDGCRSPLPWSGNAAPYGFSTGKPWLPQPSGWTEHTVEHQAADPDSFLRLYRAALAERRVSWAVAGDLRWLPAPPGVLAFARGAHQCWVNVSPDPVQLPREAEVVLTSQPGVGATLPVDTTAWVRTHRPNAAPGRLR
ncbi:glycoside hydrolase family 13 protein [Nocardia sp. NPDC127579]|uniref:glycoside hydrolase family 13 protein n=1 Tax=Nocardia sp. NPDC127579 TaxID=3345402 RepID=UPI00363D1831